jgi:hypothetical protein
MRALALTDQQLNELKVTASTLPIELRGDLAHLELEGDLASAAAFAHALRFGLDALTTVTGATSVQVRSAPNSGPTSCITEHPSCADFVAKVLLHW